MPHLLLEPGPDDFLFQQKFIMKLFFRHLVAYIDTRTIWAAADMGGCVVVREMTGTEGTDPSAEREREELRGQTLRDGANRMRQL